MNNFTRRAGALTRLLAGVAIALVCVFSTPLAQAEPVATVEAWFNLKPEVNQLMDQLAIQLRSNRTFQNRESSDQLRLDWYNNVDSADPLPLTSVDMTGSMVFLGQNNFFSADFSHVDLSTGLVYGSFMTFKDCGYQLCYTYGPVLPWFHAGSVTGGGLLTSDQPVTMTLHDMVGEQVLFDTMATYLGNSYLRIGSPQELTALRQVLDNMGDLQLTLTAIVPEGATLPFSTGVSVVPEPANWLLMGLGLAALALARLCLRHAPPAFAARRLA
ncbi:MAG: hypothetical protein RI920_285 [Pseudomonadota bacterium]